MVIIQAISNMAILFEGCHGIWIYLKHLKLVLHLKKNNFQKILNVFVLIFTSNTCDLFVDQNYFYVKLKVMQERLVLLLLQSYFR